VAVKLNSNPPVIVALAALVNAGTVPLPAALTVSVIVWLADPPPLAAVTVSEYVPAATAFVPDSVPVPSPLSAKLAPAGRPVAVSFGAGEPLVATVKEKGVPAVSVAVAALVKANVLPTVSVNAWLTVPAELLAAIVTG
jgi:hypothetical protein